MTVAWLNAVGTATPPNDVHAAFVAYARTLLQSPREQTLFDRMAERSGIAHRYSVLKPGRLEAGEVDAEGFYRPGAFPGTAARMQRYVQDALPLALRAVDALAPEGAAARSALLDGVTHLVVASCTGFVAPGLDVQLQDALSLDAGVQRTMIGFMGCAAAVPALRVAAHTVQAEPGARVLVVNLELCSLHLHESHSLEALLSFLLFGDAASAAIVSAAPAGAELLDFRSVLLPQSRPLITWDIGDQGFEMQLSGLVPARIAQALAAECAAQAKAPIGSAAPPHGLLRGMAPSAVDLWAVHAGGRTVLDAVQKGLALEKSALATSRAVLHDIGNVSSVTVMCVLQRMLANATPSGPGATGATGANGALGMAMAFGPGLAAETLRFRIGAAS